MSMNAIAVKAELARAAATVKRGQYANAITELTSILDRLPKEVRGSMSLPGNALLTTTTAVHR